MKLQFSTRLFFHICSFYCVDFFGTISTFHIIPVIDSHSEHNSDVVVELYVIIIIIVIFVEKVVILNIIIDN